MTFEMILAFAILLGALIVFVLDIYPIDFVAFSIMALILVLGPVLGVTMQEAISGFSNPATVTILAIFIISGGIYRTGVINTLAHKMSTFAGKSELKQLVTVMCVVGPISAFINNTAAVAIMIPSAISLAREHNRTPSKLLIPLSYFSQLGGVITLIGTATNILGSSLAYKAGYEPFGMFEFSFIGVFIFITGASYLLLIGRRLLPSRRVDSEVVENFRMKEYLTEVIVLENSPLIGKTVVEGRLREQFDIHVFEILRDKRKLAHPLADKIVEANDILFVKADTKQMLKIASIEGLAIEPDVRLNNDDLRTDKRKLLEVVIGPSCDLIGGTLESTNFRYHYNCTVIAIRKHGELIRERLSKVTLHFGDVLLLRGTRAAIEQIKREPGFIVTEELQEEAFRKDKIPIAMVIVSGVVIFAALGIPILITAIVGCVLMVLTGVLQVNELHESVRWDVIFLLAGIIPLGIALKNTGGADLLASLVTSSANYVSPLVVLMFFYLITVVLAEFISHSAAVVIMVPVGIAIAESLGLDARAFILASMFAAGMSFSTPVGYQTNTMVYGPGGYRFTDYMRVGGPMALIMVVAVPIYIYYFWGL